jgi:ABC-type multidrug transport system fused ATPase/permease subunit
LNAIFRAVTYESGTICIDNIDVSKLPIEYLRERLNYIPQEAILFSGTVRTNLDPYEKFEDHEIWRCLEKCGLQQTVTNLSLGIDSPIEPNEATFSKGQSQLLCIARALLRLSRVVCVDEATASVDFESENAISKVRAFRMNVVYITLIECDRLFTKNFVIQQS